MESDSRSWSAIESALEVVAGWHLLRGRPEFGVLSPLTSEAPPRVRSALSALNDISAADLLSLSARTSACEQIHRALCALDPRALEILRLRVFANDQITLDELGLRLGLTRERVRQIENKVVKELQGLETLDDVRAIAFHALGDSDTLAPLAVILGENPALSDSVAAMGQPLWRVLDRLDDSFEVVDEWWCRKSAKYAIALTQSALRTAADGMHAVRIDVVPMLKDRPWAALWVRYCGIAIHDGYALLDSSGIPARAAVTLEVEGSPMSGEEIALRIGSDRAVSSVKNALGADERFVRVDRNSWALASWGLNIYQPIRQLIVDEVAAHGGTVRLSRLVASITDRFSVSASSVIGYASAPPFVTVDGQVELASANTAVPRKSPFETRRLFRVQAGWALRFTITAEHARGSGSVLPSALIAVLGLSYGESRFLACFHGEQRLGWSGPQATLGSIRRIVEADGLQIGDTCFALFGVDASFDVKRVLVSEAKVPQRAYELAGLTLSGEAPAHEDLVEAVGLPTHSSNRQLAERLRMRGDYDIADCLGVE